jgi:hypothetical protein
MLPDTGIDDVKKQRNADYAKHINDPVLSSLKMEGIRLLFFRGKDLVVLIRQEDRWTPQRLGTPDKINNFPYGELNHDSSEVQSVA